MASDWDHYLLAVGEDLASIYLDIGLATAGPMPVFAHSCMLSVEMLQAQENGMSSDEEFADLMALEDDLAGRNQGRQGVYVGRLTTRGRRIFYFYTDDPETLEAELTTTLGRHPAYRFHVSGRPDPEWSTYFDFLYPGAEDYQRMMKRRLN